MNTNVEATGGSGIKYKKIVVPVDFSDTSSKALDYAIAMAREFGARLHLLHVLEFPAVFLSDKPAYAQWDQMAEEKATARLKEFVASKVDKAIAADAEVKLGRAYNEICESARELGADLIVIGTHGLTGIKHLVLGSTAEQVVRHAPCSVLTVRPQISSAPQTTAHPRSIVVPTDFSGPAQQALASAVTLARQFDAELRLLHVVPVYYPTGEYGEIDYRLLEAEETQTAERELKKLCEALQGQGLKVKSEMVRGRIASELTSKGTEGADLLVIATHGRTGWQHAILGSTTEEVVRHSRIPVLVVRAAKS